MYLPVILSTLVMFGENHALLAEKGNSAAKENRRKHVKSQQNNLLWSLLAN